MNLFQEIEIAGLAYKSKGASDKTTYFLSRRIYRNIKILVGYALNIKSQDYIINHTEISQVEGEDGLYEEKETQNAMKVLLHTMTMYFVGKHLKN